MLEAVRELEKQGLELKAQKKGSESAHNTAKYMFEFIYLYESRLHELNVAKGKMDVTNQAQDVEGFKTALIDFKHIVFQLTDAKRKFKARRTQQRLKIHSDLYHETLRKINFLEGTIKGGERWVKESAMSPAQLAAARKASVRMQMAWGM
jgi:hypothetical protein